MLVLIAPVGTRLKRCFFFLSQLGMEIIFDIVLPSVSAGKIVDSSCSVALKIENNLDVFFFIYVHQNASLSDSFQGGRYRSRLIGDRC